MGSKNKSRKDKLMIMTVLMLIFAAGTFALELLQYLRVVP
jgi:hypothetical protein